MILYSCFKKKCIFAIDKQNDDNMMVLKIQDSLNGSRFYGDILPSIYKSIIEGDYYIDFDMHCTELANPEGLVNLMAAAAMIRNKSGYIPQLYIPESTNLVEYMKISGFFKWAIVPGCETLRINGFMDASFKDRYRRHNYFPPQFFGVFTHSNEGTTFNKHATNIENIVNEIIESLRNNVNATNLISYRVFLNQSFVQVLKNSLEHNPGYKGTLAYYMFQKTPYNTIEFVCSDIGQGILERMKKMLKEKDPEAIKKYGHLEQKLNSKNLLFKEDDDNPNRLAIINAVKYREDSEIPGLHKIKEFAREFNGVFSIHSGNYTISYKRDLVKAIFHPDSYFSGCHLKVVMELPKSNN